MTPNNPHNDHAEDGTFRAKVSDDDIIAYFREDPSTKRCAEHFGLSRRQMRERLARLRKGGFLTADGDPGRESKLEQLIASVPPRGPHGERLQQLDVKLWGVAAKDENTQEIITHGVDGISARYRVEDTSEPKFPLIQPAAPTVVKYAAPPRILRKTQSIPVISDVQYGFLRDAQSDELQPSHDPLALDVAKQIVADLQPREMVFIGDLMDWPTFSRWQQHPEYDRVVQPSIDGGHAELADFKSAAGAKCARITMIGSNHGYRPERFILEHNMAALYLRRAGQPEEWPVFSEPFLLRYDELGITFSGQYPGGEYYILPDLAAMHAPPKSKEFGASVIHGHTHKLNTSMFVQHRYDGRFTAFTIDIGCLCQIGSSANKRRMMLTRVPSDRARTDWAQGIGVVNVVEGKFPIWTVDQVHISQGAALYGGQHYRARQLSDVA